MTPTATPEPAEPAGGASRERDALVVVPTYNEAENIELVVGDLLEISDRLDVLVVDDGSPDGTGALADAIAAREPRVTVLHRAGKQGLASAYLQGFELGHERGYRWLFEFDADGSHPADRLPAMLAELDAGADLVIGSRWVDGGGTRDWPASRELLSRAASLYSRTVLKSRIHDLTAGYRGFRAEALRALDLSSVASAGYCFQIEMAWLLERTGHRVVEVPIIFTDRALGTSKMSQRIILEALWRVTAWGLGYRARGAVLLLTGR
ncbi:MAG: polyprenol monophosphomannose synthase [Microbacteriaceae bacterium]|nr:polyprenol monophosphomannose synthase [Microbacteriaceae bacterium]